MSEKNNGDTILALLLGGAIGACLGLLFAPKSGKETRKKVKILFDDIGEKTGELIEEGKEKIEEVKEKIEEVKEKIKEVKTAVKKQ